MVVRGEKSLVFVKMAKLGLKWASTFSEVDLVARDMIGPFGVT